MAVTFRCQRPTRQLVAIADAAMYDAKEAGKNRVVVVDADTLVAEPALDSAPATEVGRLMPSGAVEGRVSAMAI